MSQYWEIKAPCHKIGYPRKRDAERAANAMFRREGDRGLHVYRCPDCDNWHLGHGNPPPISYCYRCGYDDHAEADCKYVLFDGAT